MNTIAAIIMALQAAATTPPSTMYTESTVIGRVVGPQDAVGLCSKDDAAAAHEMEEVAEHALRKTGYADMCTTPVDDGWRVVKAIADRCLPSKEGEWCEVEAHAVLVERQGHRRYVIMLVTADQLD